MNTSKKYEKQKRWERANPEKVRATKRRMDKNRRQRALDKLGGVGVRCGFTDVRALQFDHIVALRRQKGETSKPQLVASEILKGSKDYQLLCANCNWIKRAENHEYRQIIIV